jgi:hypothetical protein
LIRWRRKFETYWHDVVADFDVGDALTDRLDDTSTFVTLGRKRE